MTEVVGTRAWVRQQLPRVWDFLQQHKHLLDTWDYVWYDFQVDSLTNSSTSNAISSTEDVLLKFLSDNMHDLSQECLPLEALAAIAENLLTKKGLFDQVIQSRQAHSRNSPGSSRAPTVAPSRAPIVIVGTQPSDAPNDTSATSESNIETRLFRLTAALSLAQRSESQNRSSFEQSSQRTADAQEPNPPDHNSSLNISVDKIHYLLTSAYKNINWLYRPNSPPSKAGSVRVPIFRVKNQKIFYQQTSRLLEKWSTKALADNRLSELRAILLPH